MRNKSLIIGMGIGQLYHKVLTELDHEIITVDSARAADYTTVQQALDEHNQFDTVHICTPNYTHESIAKETAPYTKILFIEKPGLVNESAWRKLVYNFPDTRIMMVKNNMWRSNLNELRDIYQTAKEINLNWLNQNRVPNPGSWFTNKELAFGGVSRDLLPHLLSLFIAIEPKYDDACCLYKNAWQRWELKNLVDTDYGEIKLDGIYNVDDSVEMEYTLKNKRWFIRSSWRTTKPDDIAIHFDNNYNIALGLCPEDAYKAMIVESIENRFNQVFWDTQFEYDCWIHRKINL